MDLPIRQMFLAQTALWGGLPSRMLAALARDVRVREVANGEVLIHQGEEGHALFMLVDGRLEAQLTLPGNPPRVKVLGHIRRGEVVGEMALLSDRPRMCAVVAVRESQVLELSRAAFLAVVAQHPEVLFTLTDEIIRRRTESSPISAPTSVALIPHSARVDIDRFAEALHSQMKAWGTTGLLRERDVSSASGHALSEALNRFERSHKRVIYIGRPGGPARAGGGEWSRLVMRQADLVLLVADAGEDPGPAPFERAALFTGQPRRAALVDLVLVHGRAGDAPRDTARWLAQRSVRLHHHVAAGAADDFARLARLITGNANQLVLSGGGARGFAHIGVLRALEEAGVPVDFVGGTSSGSGVAALCAMRYSAERITEVLRPLLRSSVDLTLPVLALSSGKKIEQALRRAFGDRRIEDQWINYFALSADLHGAAEHVHRHGPLWQAVRASTSLPGIYPPVPLDGRYLVDGGVLNNLPVDVMAGILPGRVLAVDVSLEATLAFAAPPPMQISGWRLLLRRLNPFRKRPPDPGIADVLVRAGEIASVAMARVNKASVPVSLALRPPVAGYQALDFAAFDAIIAAGYRHASALLPSWQALQEVPQQAGAITLCDRHPDGPVRGSSAHRAALPAATAVNRAVPPSLDELPSE